MIFDVCGIKIEITFLFVAFIAFVLSLNAPSNVLITVVSSLIHECGHLITMIILGNKPKKVRFELIGINIIRNHGIGISNRNEIFIALGGPLLNLIVVFFCCIYLYFRNENLIMIFACVNLILMIFNLLPVKKLDGGIVLYYLLIKKYDITVSSQVLKITSIIFITLIFIWGAYIFITSGYNISLIIIAIFLILALFSDNEY